MAKARGFKPFTTQTQAEFFAREDVKALQDIQKRNPFGSKAHRAAFEKMAELAMEIGQDLGEYE